MKTRKNLKYLIFLFFCGWFHFHLQASFAGDSFAILAQEFAKRRAAFVQKMPDSSLAIFFAAPSKTRSNDVPYEYRQDSNFYYLTGVSQPNTILLIARNGSEQSHEAVLFMPRPHPYLASWDGAPLSEDKAKKLSGIATVKLTDDFDDELTSRLANRRNLFYTFRNELLQEPVSRTRFFISHQSTQALQEKYPGLTVHSPSAFLAQLRQIKSPAEIALMRRAIAITCDALTEAMRRARPGMFEYQLEAIIEFVFKREGAEYPAFPSIIGSGPNSTVLHHASNRRKTADGDLVVMDVGAEFCGYSADVTRTMPVNGKFNDRQREIYEIVLRAQKAALAIIKPGAPFRAAHEAAKAVIDNAGYGPYFTHGTSHYLGLDTHDVGERKPLLAGMVITVEPGIYIPEGAALDRAYWNIGIRVEDDVLVTADGCEILSIGVPREIAEIEKLMRQKSASDFSSSDVQ